MIVPTHGHERFNMYIKIPFSIKLIELKCLKPLGKDGVQDAQIKQALAIVTR